MSVIEGGEIGSGHSMMAVFEIEPTEQNINSCREQAVGDELANIRLQYHLPNDKKQQVALFSSPFKHTPFTRLEQSYRFSAAVILFGALLKESSYTRDISWTNVVELAEQSFNKEDQLQKEFVGLVQQAKNMYTKLKKKKGSLTYR
jgi:Ca-activated chloride channel family protein